MSKYLCAALMAVCLVLIATLTMAGLFWVVGEPGLHPAVALVGIIGAAIVGAMAGIGMDADTDGIC